jgi:cob(I)alamin adenosyltransferase
MSEDPIYTGMGDAGETSLSDGSRAPKDSARVEACGAVDEAASCVGLARVGLADPRIDGVLAFVQQRLQNTVAYLATPPYAVTDDTPGVSDEDVRLLEHVIDSFGTGFEGFILPAGCESAARLHVARAVVRRAERRVLSVTGYAERLSILLFLNRLSDLLYVLARNANTQAGTAEEPWDADAPRPSH